MLGARNVIQSGRHLGFYQKLEIITSRRKLRFFDAGHLKYDTIRYVPLKGFKSGFMVEDHLNPSTQKERGFSSYRISYHDSKHKIA